VDTRAKGEKGRVLTGVARGAMEEVAGAQAWGRGSVVKLAAGTPVRDQGGRTARR
jgi:hypothetical protein